MEQKRQSGKKTTKIYAQHKNNEPDADTVVC